MVTSSWNNTFISILIYSCFIYELSFVLFMFGFYQSTYSNPVIVTAYMSFLHLLLIPYLNAIRKDIPSNEKLVAVLNSIWLVSVIAVHCFLSLAYDKYYQTFKSMKIHCILLSYYFISAVLLNFGLLMKSNPSPSSEA